MAHPALQWQQSLYSGLVNNLRKRNAFSQIKLFSPFQFFYASALQVVTVVTGLNSHVARIARSEVEGISSYATSSEVW